MLTFVVKWGNALLLMAMCAIFKLRMSSHNNERLKRTFVSLFMCVVVVNDLMDDSRQIGLYMMEVRQR